MIGLFSPQIAYAAGVDTFIYKVDRLIINPLIAMLFALALAYFLYGLAEFLLNQENEEKKTTGKSHMLWGIIGIVIMMAVWTIIGIILNTLDIKGINPQQGTVQLQ